MTYKLYVLYDDSSGPLTRGYRHLQHKIRSGRSLCRLVPLGIKHRHSEGESLDEVLQIILMGMIKRWCLHLQGTS